MVRRICPRCGSNNTERFHCCMPALNSELQKQIDKGELVLGACCVAENNPSHHCNACKKDFGRKTRDYELATTSIDFSLGGCFAGYHYITMQKNDRGASIHYETPFCAEDHAAISRVINEDEWRNFVHKLYLCYITDWKRSYVNPHILDGTQWDLEVKIRNMHTIKISGSNAYPPHWKKLLKTLNSLNLAEIK